MTFWSVFSWLLVLIALKGCAALGYLLIVHASKHLRVLTGKAVLYGALTVACVAAALAWLVYGGLVVIRALGVYVASLGS